MKSPSVFSIQERRDNRKGFIENIFKGMNVPISHSRSVSITDAMKIVAQNNEEFCNYYDAGINDEQMIALWLDGDLAQYSCLIHKAVLSLADKHIGEEL